MLFSELRGAVYFRRYLASSPERRLRHYARTYANHQVRRGRLRREPCLVCGCPEVEMHHHDYRQPLVVTWLCRDHHSLVHRHAKWAVSPPVVDDRQLCFNFTFRR